MASGEDELIAWLRRAARGAGGEAIGDDAAFLPPGGPWAVTVDTQIEGVHFLPGLAPERLARRLLAVNLSDLAAVGAEPRWAVLALAVPPGFACRPFFRALLKACRGHGLRLVGGDLARGERLSAVLTLAGERVPGGRWVTRTGGRAGDGLWLGGRVGESALGRHLLARGAAWEGRGVTLPPPFEAPRSLAAAARRAVRRHLAPKPQLELGRWLAGRPRAAALDVSDGLAIDLHRLCRQSGVGGRIEARALAFPAALDALARRLGQSPLDLALAGGEDYVLLFALPAGEQPPPAFHSFQIGELTSGPGLLIEGEDGIEALAARGWDHLATGTEAGAGSQPRANAPIQKNPPPA